LWLDEVLREFKGPHALPWRGQAKSLMWAVGLVAISRPLEDQGWDVSGIEVSEEAAAHARALIGGTIHTGTLESHPFAPNTFDLILMSHSLEHFLSPADALRRVRALLKDGGFLS
jgi:2-polyprenyl-3-methyl-5-hydroxy-6-metoxy-1,4-benzoquinol methylase